MTPSQLEQHFRSDVDDRTAPYLWTTTEVWEYMNAAQWKFAKKVGVSIRDASTAEFCELAITEDDPWVLLNPNTTRVRAARLESTGKLIPIVSYEEMFSTGASDDYGVSITTSELDLAGPVRAAIIGMEEDKLRLVRIPEADDTLLLVVERLPLEVLETEVDDDPVPQLEIRRDYHLDLLLWMKHLAYSKQDADTFDKERAADMADMFYARCEEARQETEKKLHKPRLMAYGGI